MTKLKLLQDAVVADKAGSNLDKLKKFREIVDPSLSLKQVQEMFDIEITPNDYNVWLDNILDICKKNGKRPTSKRHFDDCAFEVLDNDPKMDLFVGDDSEKVKRRVANTLWNAYQASSGHAKIAKAAAAAMKNKAKEEEERGFFDRPDVGSDNMDVEEIEDIEVPAVQAQGDTEDFEADRDYSEDDINTMTGKYPEEDLGGWDVPLKGNEECEEEEKSGGLKVAAIDAIVKAGTTAGKKDATRERKTKNPYTKGTTRHDIWKAAYREGLKSLKKAVEEEEMVQSQQNNGYKAAREYYDKVKAAARGARNINMSATMNPHKPGTKEGAAWDKGFDQFMKDCEIGD